MYVRGDCSLTYVEYVSYIASKMEAQVSYKMCWRHNKLMEQSYTIMRSSLYDDELKSFKFQKQYRTRVVLVSGYNSDY